eukprot:TRINITY_DN14788_c0_g1_i1.p1 TRINITY_DN14788_c0_g1~~TRINITY_DN14788_c0_g1_i1.p1  ORF type:complete len:673 (-),score=162.97 TRINITY_DN14788_c0_g1_i1:74-2092(-)
MMWAITDGLGSEVFSPARPSTLALRPSWCLRRCACQDAPPPSPCLPRQRPSASRRARRASAAALAAVLAGAARASPSADSVGLPLGAKGACEHGASPPIASLFGCRDRQLGDPCLLEGDASGEWGTCTQRALLQDVATVLSRRADDFAAAARPRLQPRALVRLFASLARLGRGRGSRVLAEVEERLPSHLDDLEEADLAELLLALDNAGRFDDGSSKSSPFALAIVAKLPVAALRSKPRNEELRRLPALLWAWAKVVLAMSAMKPRAEALVRQVEGSMLGRLALYHCDDLSIAYWALATLCFAKPDALLRSLAEQLRTHAGECGTRRLLDVLLASDAIGSQPRQGAMVGTSASTVTAAVQAAAASERELIGRLKDQSGAYLVAMLQSLALAHRPSAKLAVSLEEALNARRWQLQPQEAEVAGALLRKVGRTRGPLAAAVPAALQSRRSPSGAGHSSLWGEVSSWVRRTGRSTLAAAASVIGLDWRGQDGTCGDSVASSSSSDPALAEDVRQLAATLRRSGLSASHSTSALATIASRVQAVSGGCGMPAVELVHLYGVLASALRGRRFSNAAEAGKEAARVLAIFEEALSSQLGAAALPGAAWQREFLELLAHQGDSRRRDGGGDRRSGAFGASSSFGNAAAAAAGCASCEEGLAAQDFLERVLRRDEIAVER